MRRLKTLNRDKEARHEVGEASKQCQSGDMMDFGLLCFERGRMRGFQTAYTITHRVHQSFHELMDEIPDDCGGFDLSWKEDLLQRAIAVGIALKALRREWKRGRSPSMKKR